MNKTERDEYERSKLVYSELKSAIDTSKEEGRNERTIEFAKMMKDKGYSIREISELTELTAEKIENL